MLLNIHSICQNIRNLIFNEDNEKLNFIKMAFYLILNLIFPRKIILLHFFSMILNSNLQLQLIQKKLNRIKHIFELNRDNFEYTTNNRDYIVIYSNIDDEYTSQSCELKLSFYISDKKGDICDNKGDCYVGIK